jgi:hypothetical protein
MHEELSPNIYLDPAPPYKTRLKMSALKLGTSLKKELSFTKYEE